MRIEENNILMLIANSCLRRGSGRQERVLYRMGRSFDRSRFKDQEASLRKMMKRSRRLKRLCIDRHGIGMNMAENLRSEFGSRVEGVTSMTTGSLARRS